MQCVYSGTIFSKEADFSEVTCSKEANFIYAKFSDFADFSAKNRIKTLQW
jgi:hypothetical protein